MDKICSYCNIVKDINKGQCCRECVNKKQRIYRKLSGNESTKRYEKTLNGYIMRTYRNMLSRVTGILKTKAHLYKGLDILSKDDFVTWSLSNSSNLKHLIYEYEKSGYDMRFAPSIDRIDSKRGYTLDNIRWITHSENSKMGSHSRHHNGGVNNGKV